MKIWAPYPIPPKPVPVHRAPGILNQAAPVVNTWYDVLATRANCRLIALVLYMTTGEDIELEVIIDGRTLALARSINDSTYYYVFYTGIGDNLTADVTLISTRPFIVEGQSVRVRMRKTSTNGVVNMQAWAANASW
jgi:hypothetical protein